MSNEVCNQYVEFGEPLGDSEGLYEIADWAGDMLSLARILIRDARPPLDPRRGAQWLIDRERWMNGLR